MPDDASALGDEIADVNDGAIDEPELDESGKPKDGKKWVRKESLVAVTTQITELRQANRDMQARLDAALQRQAPPAKEIEPAKRYTRAELTAMVSAGQITQDQSDEVFAKQVREEAKAEAVVAATHAVSTQTRQERITEDIARYTRAEPEILKNGSDIRNRVTEEFNYLVQMGDPGRQDDPNTLGTQLKAIRAVLGPLEKVELARSGTNGAEGHRESGNSGGNQRKLKSFKESMSQREQDGVEKLIRAGQYKDWKDAEETMKTYGRARA